MSKRAQKQKSPPRRRTGAEDKFTKNFLPFLLPEQGKAKLLPACASTFHLLSLLSFSRPPLSLPVLLGSPHSGEHRRPVFHWRAASICSVSTSLCP